MSTFAASTTRNTFNGKIFYFVEVFYLYYMLHSSITEVMFFNFAFDRRVCSSYTKTKSILEYQKVSNVLCSLRVIPSILIPNQNLEGSHWSCDIVLWHAFEQICQILGAHAFDVWSNLINTIGFNVYCTIVKRILERTKLVWTKIILFCPMEVKSSYITPLPCLYNPFLQIYFEQFISARSGPSDYLQARFPPVTGV